jgi:hypothetical protein
MVEDELASQEGQEGWREQHKHNLRHLLVEQQGQLDKQVLLS